MNLHSRTAQRARALNLTFESVVNGKSRSAEENGTDEVHLELLEDCQHPVEMLERSEYRCSRSFTMRLSRKMSQSRPGAKMPLKFTRLVDNRARTEGGGQRQDQS